jgi:hypothetical protein
MLRLLPYLGGLLLFCAFIVVVVVLYRYATRDTRIAPKRKLLKQLADARLELHEVDQVMENLVDTAKLWKDTEPNMAHTVIYNISGYKSARSKRDKELNK